MDQQRHSHFTKEIRFGYSYYTRLLANKPCTTPIVNDNKLMSEKVAPLEDITSFQRLIGRLLYLTNTRPHISFIVQFLSQLLQAPIIHYQIVALHILRYVINSLRQGFFSLETPFSSLKHLVS